VGRDGLGESRARVTRALLRRRPRATGPVNSVSPGLTDDSVLRSFGDAAVDIARKWHGSGWTLMGRMGTPADIGNVVALLCSPDAGWMTGQLIYADGGASLADTLLPLEIQRG
jgi:NAD(P)-dependent dehydrogenase (short-subunit alcohol dehydrogenase family)